MLRRPATAVRKLARDNLYRGSLLLLINTAIVAVIGFVFWTLAAHYYPASAIGIFAGITSGVNLLAAIAALGLPNTITRRIATSEDARGLVLVMLAAICTAGTAICSVAVIAAGSDLPASLGLRDHGSVRLLIVALVALTAGSSVLDCGLIAIRSTQIVLVKNVLGSAVKLCALLLLSGFGVTGLLASYGLGLVISTTLEAGVLLRQVGSRRARLGLRQHLRSYFSLAWKNYLATILGILPVSLVPLEVLFRGGPGEAGRFAAAFLVASFLSFVPSAVSQVMFAEASRKGVYLTGQLRKAVRGIYGLLLPSVALVVAAAPLALRLFGRAYAAEATGCLRILALSALLAGGTYLVDALLIARDRVNAYVFINGVNAALVLVCVWVFLPHGLTAAAGGWTLAQGISLITGLILLAAGKLGRHHPAGRQSPSEIGRLSTRSQRRGSGQIIYAFEPQIRDLLATCPLMPTVAIADRIGWQRPLGELLVRVCEMRRECSPGRRDSGEIASKPGQVAEIGLWFGPTDVPMGAGQVRSGRDLPVLVMVTEFSRWTAATLLPSVAIDDVLLGCWSLLADLAAVPRSITWTCDVSGDLGGQPLREVVARISDFGGAVGTRFTFGEVSYRLSESCAAMERTFLDSRSFVSPSDFNSQLRAWLVALNRTPQAVGLECPADLVVDDRLGMAPVPADTAKPYCRKLGKVPRSALVRFDSCDYSVHPAAIGRSVEIVADLERVQVFCGPELVADHARIWARNRMIRADGEVRYPSGNPHR